MRVELDDMDKSILVELQSDGRLSDAELSQRVKASVETCADRRKQMEDAGVISHYGAVVDPRTIGQHGVSVTIASIARLTAEGVTMFENAVRAEPRITDCFYVAGSSDYVIRFAYSDPDDLELFHSGVLARLPGVVRLNSMLVLRTVVKRPSAVLF